MPTLYSLGLVSGRIKVYPGLSEARVMDDLADRLERAVTAPNYPVLYASNGHEIDSIQPWTVYTHEAGERIQSPRYMTWFALMDSLKAFAAVLSTPVGWTHADA